MIVCGEKKRPGGKLVKACLRVSGNRIRGILLTGDFFAEPDEALEELLERLSGLEVSTGEAPQAVARIIESSGVRLYGISLDEVVEAIERALASLGRGSG